MKDNMLDNDLSFIVKDIIMYKLGLEESQLRDAANFRDDLGIDSLDILDLKMELEKKFEIKLTDEESDKLTTIGSLIQFINNKNKRYEKKI